MTGRLIPGTVIEIGRANGDIMTAKHVLLLICFFACSDTEPTGLQAQGSDAEASMQDTGLAAGGQDEEAEASVPSAWDLSGSFRVIDGQLDAGLSHLTADIYDEDGASICRQGLGVASTRNVEILPDPDLQSWWEINVDSTQAGDCVNQAVQVPTSHPIYLGLGALHPEIEAVLDSEAGPTPPEDVEVRSVFVALGADARIWIFGVATLDDSAQGDALEETIAIQTLRDGQWKFKALYSFPY